MNIFKTHKELYNGSEYGFSEGGIELFLKEVILKFRYCDLIRFNNLKIEFGLKDFEKVVNTIDAKIKIPGIYSSNSGQALSYLKLKGLIVIISHEEIQPDAYVVCLEGVISNI